MFVMGACGIVYEYVLSVLGNYLIGSSHEEIFIVIGLMMFAMGIGSGLQGQIRNRLFEAFLGLEIALGVVGAWAAIMVYLMHAVSESYRIALYGFALLIGTFIGMEIPLLIRINRQYAQDLRGNLSQILSMDYIGSLTGALVFTYVLLTKVSLAKIGFILGATNIAVALVGLYAFRASLERPRRLVAVALVALASIALGLIYADDWTRTFEQRYFADPIIHRETTKYQHIVITKRDKTVNLYLNGHLQFSSDDEHIYHETLVHPPMLLAPKVARVLVLGGGDGLAVREVLKHPGVEEVTLVDIDAAMIRLAQQHPQLVRLNKGSLGSARVRTHVPELSSAERKLQVRLKSERSVSRFQGPGEPVATVEVAVGDADRLLRALPGPYDVVIIDFPDPSRLEIAKLYTRGFYRRLSKLLAPGAVISTQATSPFHAKTVFLCIGETLRAEGFAAVPYHENVPRFGEWGFYVARLGGASELLRAQMRSLDRLSKIPTRYLTAEVLDASTRFGKGWLTPKVQLEPNTRMRPVVLTYYRDAWSTY